VGETCGTHGRGRGVCGILVGRPELKRTLGRLRPLWEDIMKLDLTEIDINVANRIRLAQDMFQWRVFMSTVMNLRVS
jgi:hypothetical protein